MKSFKLFIMALFALAGCPGLVQAQTMGKGEVKAYIVKGDVQLKDSKGQMSALTRGQTFEDGNSVITGNDGSALLVFSNGAAMQVKPNSHVDLVKFDQAAFDASEGDFIRLTRDPSKSTTNLNLSTGTLSGEVKKLNLDAGSSFAINTPAGSAGIRGTIVSVTVGGTATNPIITIVTSAGTVVLTPATIAGLPDALQHGAVEVTQGGQVVLQTSVDPTTGQVNGMSIQGTALSTADAQTLIGDLYTAINDVRQEQNLPPVTPPAPPPPNAPSTGGGNTNSQNGGQVTHPNTNPTIISQ